MKTPKYWLRKEKKYWKNTSKNLVFFLINVKICSMVEQTPKEEALSIIREIEANPCTTQRVLSKKLSISLGKTNYLLNALIKKGLIKAKNFSDNPGKMQKIHYYLTRNGLKQKMQLMRHFLMKKEIEYNAMKQEWENLSSK